jgi:hypothetical protein
VLPQPILCRRRRLSLAPFNVLAFNIRLTDSRESFLERIHAAPGPILNALEMIS